MVSIIDIVKLLDVLESIKFRELVAKLQAPAN